ncbi:TPA: hypothetical protein ACH3X3_008821 [Trebouxia sp. C0006]
MQGPNFSCWEVIGTTVLFPECCHEVIIAECNDTAQNLPCLICCWRFYVDIVLSQTSDNLAEAVPQYSRACVLTSAKGLIRDFVSRTREVMLMLCSDLML